MLALTCHIELFTQVHYRQSIEPDTDLSELWKDVFLFHWKEESQHAILDELEWRREHARSSRRGARPGVSRISSSSSARSTGSAVQAKADVDYFLANVGPLPATEEAAMRDVVLKAYRWQYIVSGAQEPRFGEVLAELVTPAQMQRIGAALGPIVEHATRATH